jgi:nucleotidyltransferase substrate binding protein (TIGR01987 family)
MEKLTQQREMVVKALTTLHDAIEQFEEVDAKQKYYIALRNSIIKSFEYSMDIFWKFLKRFIEVKHGLVAPSSPRAIFKQCLDINIISPDEFNACMKVVEDRNMTSHTYDVDLAEKISRDIPTHYTIIKKITDRLTP